MEKKISIQWLPTIILASIFILLTANISMHAMAWTIVTSENDAGPGTLREAINMVNNGGSADPNAIAFAKNVKTIRLNSLLPHITEPVLIDGLAKVKNGTVVQEGDCSAIPSPVDDPCAFSCALRVTIDGSTIPITESPSLRHALSIIGDNVTLRGLCITNITTPEPDSVAWAIVSIGSNNTIECCEVKEIRNTAGTSFDPLDNYAAGIVTSLDHFINKTYIHNIQGGIVTIGCNDALNNDNRYVSGSAFGISTRGKIQDTRVEEVKSGGINICQPDSTGEEDLMLLVGTAIGITTNIQDFIIPLSLRAHKGPKRDCPLAGACPGSEPVCNSGKNIDLSVKDSIINTIIGGAIISNIPHSQITQNLIAGIAANGINSQLPIDLTLFVNESILTNIHTGSATVSGDNSELTRLGSMGIILLEGPSIICCNTLTNITLDPLTLYGYNTKAITGFSYGMALGISRDSLLRGNTISNITGGSATAHGKCNTLLPSTGILENVFLSRIKRPIKKHNTKSIPAGRACNPQLPFSVAGIYIPACNFINIDNNKVNNIYGIKHTLRGVGTEALTVGSAGITVGSQSSDNVFIDKNSVQSVYGPDLDAFASMGKIQNLQGSVGIDANGSEFIITNNCIKKVREGNVHAQNSSLVAHFTDTSSFNLLKKLRSIPSLYKNISFNLNTETFVPVVTIGIAANGNRTESKFAPTPGITIQNNTISDISGAIVPNESIKQGSVGIGIFAQPSIDQLEKLKSKNLNSLAKNKQNPLFNTCKDTKETLGSINSNSIATINGGTNAPSYGIMVDGSQLFLQISNAGTNTDLLSLGLFNITKNIITNLNGNGSIKPFVLTTKQLNSLPSCCFEVNGTDGSECDFKNSFIPLLPFEPTSGIYTLFGGCSTLSSNTITNVQDSKADARGITTAASSDIKVFDNMISYIKGFGIFVGGSTIDETLTTGSEFIVTDTLPSLRNKIYNNSIFDNSNKGIKLGLINWNYFLFARDFLNACRRKSVKFDQETTEDSLVTYGNHGQVAPCIKKVTRNGNGSLTIDITLENTLQLTNFVIQFFKNNSNTIPHGKQRINLFNNPQFIVQTNLAGNAQSRFTFFPIIKIEKNDTFSAHVTVQDVSPIREESLGDTSEFSTNTQKASCSIGLLKPNKPRFSRLVN